METDHGTRRLAKFHALKEKRRLGAMGALALFWPDAMRVNGRVQSRVYRAYCTAPRDDVAAIARFIRSGTAPMPAANSTGGGT